MAPLPNARHERFAQEIAKGSSAGEAYRLAGYSADEKSAESAGPRLFRNVQVQARVAELQERSAVKVEITADTLIQELEEARTLAATNNQSGAMVQATIGKAKLLGLIVEKREDVTPRRNRKQILAELTELIERRGTGEGGGTVPGASGGRADDKALPTVSGHGTA